MAFSLIPLIWERLLSVFARWSDVKSNKMFTADVDTVVKSIFVRLFFFLQFALLSIPPCELREAKTSKTCKTLMFAPVVSHLVDHTQKKKTANRAIFQSACTIQHCVVGILVNQALSVCVSILNAVQKAASLTRVSDRVLCESWVGLNNTSAGPWDTMTDCWHYSDRPSNRWCHPNEKIPACDSPVCFVQPFKIRFINNNQPSRASH